MSAGADLDSIPKPITPGPEMAALARFHTDVTWTGTIEAGGMGPGTPAMTGSAGASMRPSRTAAGSSAPTSKISSCPTGPSC